MNTKLHLTDSEKKALKLIIDCGSVGYFGYDRGKDQLQMLARLDELEKVKGFHFRREPVPNSRSKRYFYAGFSGHPDYLIGLGFDLPFINPAQPNPEPKQVPCTVDSCMIEDHYKFITKEIEFLGKKMVKQVATHVSPIENRQRPLL